VRQEVRPLGVEVQRRRGIHDQPIRDQTIGVAIATPIV
jgi:hypothetical protein